MAAVSAAAAPAVAAQREHCEFCFATLEAALLGAEAPAARFAGLDARAPLFVTWKKRDGRGELALRGCIGNFSDLQLVEGLRDYALCSALSDNRFDPVSADELPLLEVSVSLLVDFEPAADAFDWTVGEHGIRISFLDPVTRTTRSGTFLPEVAPEQGWDKRATLDALVRKTGCRAPVTDDLLASIKLVRYRSSKTGLSWDEYVQVRDSQGPPATS